MTTTGTDRLAAPTSPRAGAFAERISAVRERAWAPVDPASLSAFRVALGGLLAATDRRYRVAAREPQPSPYAAEAAR